MPLLEKDKHFSQSKIWSLQRTYYQNKGVDAWRSGEVPHYITNNPTVGRTYAELVLAFLRDLSLKNKNNRTVYLLELGAGHGRLCYHFFKHFEKYYESSSLNLPPFCYILSDFVESNVAFWKEHPRLKPYFKKKWLDVAVFDAEKEESIQLQYQKKDLERLEQPLIVVANYFFDSIPQDLFKVQNNQLFDCLLSLNTPNSAPKISLESLSLDYTYKRFNIPENEIPVVREILSTYKKQLSETHILFPAAGIKCIEYLRKLSKGGLLLLSGDKGYHHRYELENRPIPDLSIHGSISLMVNYHALKEYCRLEKGEALFPLHQHVNLDVGCLLFLPDAGSYKELKNTYQRFVQDYGPDDFFTQKKLLEQYFEDLSCQEILSIVRFSNYDARIFIQLLPRLMALVSDIKRNERFSVFQAVHQIWANYYPLGEDEDLAAHLGNLLFQLHFYRAAIVYYDLSLKIYGQSDKTLYYIALCYCLLDEYKDACPIIKELQKNNPGNRDLERLVDEFA